MLIQLDDRTIINHKQLLWAFKDTDSTIHACGYVDVCFVGRNGEERRKLYDGCGQIWQAIKENAKGYV